MIGLGLAPTMLRGGGGFNPASLSGLALWLRLGQPAAYTDVGLTTLATNGQDVAGWKGMAALPSALESTNKPVFTAAGGPNGPSIDFTATNSDKLAVGSASDWTFMHNGDGCTIYFVAKIGAGVNCPILDTGGISSGAGVIAFVDDSGAAGRLTFAVRNASGGIVNLQTASAYNVWPDATWHIGCASYGESVTPTEAKLWIDGGYLLGADSSGAPAAGDPAGALTLGFSLPSGAIKLTGSLVEILVYAGVHTEAQRRAVHNYLGDRHAIPSLRLDCLGHSIMEGDGSNSGTPISDHGVNVTESIPERVAALLGSRYRVRNLAWSGANIASGGPNTDVQEAWEANSGPPAQGVSVCAFWMGINDVRSDIPEATIKSAFDARMAAALATGTERRVVVVNIGPFANDSGWSSGRQTVAESINDYMAAFVAANPTVARLVDAYALLGDPDSPTEMLAAYDSGDGLHCGNAGLQAIADAIAPAVRSFGLG